MYFSHITPRRLATLAVATAALLLPSAAQAASAPTLEVDVADRAISVESADHLGRGPLRLHMTGESLNDNRTVFPSWSSSAT